MKKKIMYVVRPVDGGISEHVKELLRYLKTSYELVVVCPPQKNLIISFQGEGARIVSVNISGNFDPLRDIHQVLMLARVIKKEKPDLIHLHGFKTGFLGRAAALGFPRTPLVLTVHNYYAYPGQSRIPFLIFQTMEKVFSHRTNRVITVSEALKKNLTHSLGIQEEKIVKIYNGIQPENYQNNRDGGGQFKAALGLPQGIPLVGTTARLAPQKGLETLLEAARIILDQRDDCFFLVAGEGPMREKLEDMVNGLALRENVFFLGRINNIAEFLSSLDVFVLPSLTEGLSISLLEALAAKKPVVASRVGGIPEIIIDGVTGSLVPPGDPVSLASRVVEYLEHPERGALMGLQGCRRIEEYFDLEGMLTKTEELYKVLWHK